MGTPETANMSIFPPAPPNHQLLTQEKGGCRKATRPFYWCN